MKKTHYSLLFSLLLSSSAFSQEVTKLYSGKAPGSENCTC
ncbi:hypothetical protein HNP25_003437 [Arcicella rosea]|uniref:Uncharacterized protein n=1 Tax=Arcicella rosea TaxID=502909 RepID=A0A841EKS2_9BACT|nr:hypothetical protein [Arcicella rosea]